jgi:DNA-binding CsgD family transcriptional regulator
MGGDMVAEPRRRGGPSGEVTTPENDDVEELARDLIIRVRGHAVGDVLLDVEVEGTHYQLTRRGAEAAEIVALSPREQEIARMVAQGHPNKTIASALQISSWTVNTHLRRVFAKLGVTSRAAMVARLAARPQPAPAHTSDEAAHSPR